VTVIPLGELDGPPGTPLGGGPGGPSKLALKGSTQGCARVLECGWRMPNAKMPRIEKGLWWSPPLLSSVKDSGFSPNPYSSHFLFFSIYSSHFLFMWAFGGKKVSWSLLWLLWLVIFTEVWVCDLSSFQETEVQVCACFISYAVADHYLSLSVR